MVFPGVSQHAEFIFDIRFTWRCPQVWHPDTTPSSERDIAVTLRDADGPGLIVPLDEHWRKPSVALRPKGVLLVMFTI